MSIGLTPSARQLRKAAVQSARVAIALSKQVEQQGEALDTLGEILLARKLFGRLKWLLTGR